MTDQLISFETAKLAKEKGFKRDELHVSDKYYTIGESGFKEGILNHVQCGIPAPTQSLLQRWLREEHNIAVVIAYMWGYKIFNVKDDIDEDLGHSMISYETYEEALEQGLIEALKLIP